MKDTPGVSLVTSAASYACKYFNKITVNTAGWEAYYSLRYE